MWNNEKELKDLFWYIVANWKLGFLENSSQ